MSEFLDSLIDRKIVTDATSIEDLQIEAGGSGSSSASPLKTFVDLFMGADTPDDYPVGVRVDDMWVKESNGILTVRSNIAGSEYTLTEGNLYDYSPGSPVANGAVMLYDIENKTFVIPAVLSTIDSDSSKSFILIPISLSLFNNLNAMYNNYNTSLGICMYNTSIWVEALRTSILSSSPELITTIITYGELANY